MSELEQGAAAAQLSWRETIVALGKSLRPHQWVKNGFVFVPLVFTPEKWSLPEWEIAISGALLFCLASSASYLVNDLRDLEADRAHPRKSRRPLAAGQLSVSLARGSALVLGVAALLGAGLLGWPFVWILSGYLVLQLLYSLLLKHVVILDVMALAAGFVLRVLAGGAAVEIPVSRWLLVTTSLLALFLGFTKRRQELAHLGSGSAEARQVLANYRVEFIDQLNAVLAGSCIVCYALYTLAPETVERFGTDNLILTWPFVVYGILRYLHLVHVRQLGDDPTELFLVDHPLQLCVGFWLATFLLIIRYSS